jgi:galactofuranose transport system ATP-binding protein
VTTSPPLLQLRAISKSFGAARALDGVDLDLLAGSVHALVGENGAGKSTLIKIITGAHPRDGGSMALDGQPVTFRSPQEAQAHGVVAVYQEVNLLAYATVAETLFLGREPTRFGWLDAGRMNTESRRLLDELDLQIDPRMAVGALPIALRQMVAIARGVSLAPRVLILDEPTSSLTAREVTLLYAIVRRMAAAGTAVVYVSHRLDELYAICDRITILRDGRLVETRPLAGLDRIDLVASMLGRGREEVAHGATAFHSGAPERPPAIAPAATTPVMLRLQAAQTATRLRGVSLTVARGEIVGLAGLLGAGRTETAELIFGLEHLTGGALVVDGAEVTFTSARDAIARGFAFLTEDRKRDGLIPDLSIAENLTLAALPLLSRGGVVIRARQREVVADLMARLRIKAAGPDQPIRELSGGNQQKVLLARWLCRAPRLILLDEPTRGIDVGAKREIQTLIATLAAEGMGVLLISSELTEIVEGSDRVVVLSQGRTVSELSGVGGGQIDEPAILRALAATGAAPP